MITLIKTIFSFPFLFGLIVGVFATFIFKPLIDVGLKKLFSKND